LGEGRGEGKKLAMQEVIAKALYPAAVFRLKDINKSWAEPVDAGNTYLSFSLFSRIRINSSLMFGFS
jgi:hypothetical protein